MIFRQPFLKKPQLKKIKRRQTMKKVFSLIVLASLVLGTLLSAGCAVRISAEDMTAGYTGRAGVGKETDERFASAVTALAVRLFRASYSAGECGCISPLSLVSALAMCENGAAGNTLSQFEELFGLTRDELNGYMYTYLNSITSSGKVKFNTANSIWLRDSFVPTPTFLQSNANYYSAAVYRSDFGRETVKDINEWVRQNTDGIIKKTIDTIPKTAVFYLVNATVFDAEWATVYEKSMVSDGTFTSYSGERRTARMMRSEENKYISGDGVTGFMKYYSGGRYALATLLPETDIDGFIAGLDGGTLRALISGAEGGIVRATMPRFSFQSDYEMCGALSALGLTDAFSSDADFSALGATENGDAAYIASVIHKTDITVDERGTRAGAVTVIRGDATSADHSRAWTVTLDRPFVFVIVDTETGFPVFMGAVTDV